MLGPVLKRQIMRLHFLDDEKFEYVLRLELLVTFAKLVLVSLKVSCFI